MTILLSTKPSRLNSSNTRLTCLLLTDCLDVSLSGMPHGSFGIALHSRIPPAAIDSVKGKRLHSLDNTLDSFCIQRDQVGITIHKADKAPVLRYIHSVAGQKRTAPLSTRGPVQHIRAGEMPSAAHQG